MDEVTKALLSYGVLGIAVVVMFFVIRQLRKDEKDARKEKDAAVQALSDQIRALEKQRHDELIAIVTEQAAANARATSALEHAAESIDKLVDALYQNPGVRPRLPSRS